METRLLDIVYFVKDAPLNEELRYSLRSVCKNMPHARVWIFGGLPRGIYPDVHIKIKQTGRTKWDKVRNMFIAACKNKELSEDFVLFNDDFFIMQPIDKIEPLYRCSLENHIKVLAKGSYRELLTTVMNDLKHKNKTTLSYELHTPFLFNKKKLLKLIENTPDLHCTRTLYGNIYKIGGEKSADVKVFNSRPTFDYRHSKMLSTDDSVMNINNDVWRYIKKSFPDKCEYEA